VREPDHDPFDPPGPARDKPCVDDYAEATRAPEPIHPARLAVPNSPADTPRARVPAD